MEAPGDFADRPTRASRGKHARQWRYRWLQAEQAEGTVARAGRRARYGLLRDARGKPADLVGKHSAAPNPSRIPARSVDGEPEHGESRAQFPPHQASGESETTRREARPSSLGPSVRRPRCDPNPRDPSPHTAALSPRRVPLRGYAQDTPGQRRVRPSPPRG